MYAFVSNYFKLFQDYEPEQWRLPHLEVWKKALLFAHTFCSISMVQVAIQYERTLMDEY